MGIQACGASVSAPRIGRASRDDADDTSCFRMDWLAICGSLKSAVSVFLETGVCLLRTQQHGTPQRKREGVKKAGKSKKQDAGAVSRHTGNCPVSLAIRRGVSRYPRGSEWAAFTACESIWRCAPQRLSVIHAPTASPSSVRSAFGLTLPVSIPWRTAAPA